MTFDSKEIIKKKEGYIYKKIEKSSIKYELIPTRDGAYTLKKEGKLISSMYKPISEAKKMIEKYEFYKIKIVLLFGIGLGYHLEELLKKIDVDTKVIAFETDMGLLKSSVESGNFEKIIRDKRVEIFTSNENDKFLKYLSEIIKIGVAPRYLIVKHKVLYDIDYEFYKGVENSFKEFLKENIINMNTLFSFGKQWIRNSFRNMNDFSNSLGVKEFEGLFKGIAGVVVSAGPSLDKNIEYLHWIKGKAPIIAVGTIVGKLLDNGIKPDFIVTMDGGEPNWEHFKRVDYSSIPLVYEPMVHYSIVKHSKSKNIVFTSNNPVATWMEGIVGKKGFLRQGGSVAVSAYDFALTMGCNPIILLGQDLAYSKGRTHASGTLYKDILLDEEKENDFLNVDVKNIFGNRVKTDVRYNIFRTKLESYISEDKNKNSKLLLLDCTEGGAFIKETIPSSLKKVYYEYIDFLNVEVTEKINLVFKNQLEKENSEVIDNEIRDLVKNMKNLKRKVLSGIKLINKMLGSGDYNKINELEKLDAELESDKKVSNLLHAILQPIILKIINSENDSGDISSLKKTLDLYNWIIKGLDYNINCMEEIL